MLCDGTELTRLETSRLETNLGADDLKKD